MPSLPGQALDIYFGDAETPLPDWRQHADEDAADDPEDALTDEGLAAVRAVLGFDPDEASTEEVNEPVMIRSSPFRNHKSLLAYHTKDQGQPCEQGETSAQTECVPASGEATSKKPTLDEAKRAYMSLDSKLRGALKRGVPDEELRELRKERSTALRSYENLKAGREPQRQTEPHPQVSEAPASKPKPSVPVDDAPDKVVTTEQAVLPEAPAQEARAESPDQIAVRQKATAKLVDSVGRSTTLKPQQKTRAAVVVNAIATRMGSVALERFNKGASAVMFHGAPADLAARLKKLRLGGQFKNPGGAYYGAEGYLLLVEHGSESLTAGTAAHEISHAVDGPKYELSGSSEWREAWKELEGGEVSDYARTSLAEGFAEFGRLLYAGSRKAGGDLTLQEIEIKFPKCVAFWKKNGLLVEGT